MSSYGMLVTESELIFYLSSHLLLLTENSGLSQHYVVTLALSTSVVSLPTLVYSFRHRKIRL